MTLHMVKLIPDMPRLIRWAERRELRPANSRNNGLGANDDLGYAWHTALTEAFGALAPKPFALVEHRARRPELLGYTAHDADRLRDHAQSFADPDICTVIGLATLAGKPMPDRFAPDRRLGFTLRARPTIRTDRVIDGVADRAKAAEHDAYRKPAGEDPDTGPSRADVYQGWLATRLAAGGATLNRFGLDQFRRSVSLRRGRNRQLQAVDLPDAHFSGVLVVKDPEKFAAVLAHGVGRHAAFGYGMLLLRPA